MKPIALPLAVAVFLASCAVPCTAAAARDTALQGAARKLPAYEKLTYHVAWLGIPVGTITASIKGIKKIQGRDAYELEITAKTNDFCSRIYSVNDRYVSFMDTEKLYTLRHEVYRRDGRYKKDAATDFDRARGKAYFRNFLDKSEKTIDIPSDIQDPVSMVYFFRTVPLQIGQHAEFHVYNNESTYLLCGVADRIKTLRLPGLGPVEAFRIQPYAKLEGALVRKGKASMYVSCDEKRIPVTGSVRAPLFTEITAYLVKVE